MLAILFQEYGLRFLENTGLPGGIRYGPSSWLKPRVKARGTEKARAAWSAIKPHHDGIYGTGWAH
jgi:hypothetical protein